MLTHFQKVKSELSLLLNNTQLFYFHNNIAYTLDQHDILYFKRQVAHHLHSITRTLNRDCWTIIADLLFATHSLTIYSIITQISPVYQSAMLPFLTMPPPIKKSTLLYMAQQMQINLILHKPQICPEYVVRLEQFDMETVIQDDSKTTWVIYTEPVDCLLAIDHISELQAIMHDPAISIDPVCIRGEFLLTLDAAESTEHKFSNNFMQIAYNFYYNNGTYRRDKSDFDAFTGTRFNAVLAAWGGSLATIPQTRILLKTFIAQCIKVSTSINGVVSIICGNDICRILRFPNQHYFICLIDPEHGVLSLPYFTYQQLKTYTRISVKDFLLKYGELPIQ
jgi:hypothetical protein